MKFPKSPAFRALLALPILLALTAFALQHSGFCDILPNGNRMCCSTDKDGKILDCREILPPPAPVGD